MNLKTTILLLLLVGIGAGAWYWLDRRQPAQSAESPTATFLKDSVSEGRISRGEASKTFKPLPTPITYAGIVAALANPQGPVLATLPNFEGIPESLFVL